MPATSTNSPHRAARSVAAVATALLLFVPGISCTHSHYHDMLFYEDIAWGVVTGLDDVYRENVDCLPPGCVDILACGPSGGIVHTTGTKSCDYYTGIRTVHLRYELSECRFSFASSSSNLDVDLALSGVVYEHSSWTRDCSSISYESPGLWLAGSAMRGYEERSVDDVSEFWATSTNSGTSAELFGYDLAW
jgi:hypothetical protein